jgi:hypothetical protein
MFRFDPYRPYPIDRMGVSISLALPIIVGAWLTFYFFSYGQQMSAWIATIVGIIACWAVYRTTFVP